MNLSLATSEQKLANTLRTKINFQKTTIHGYEINYVTAGSGPPILLIHGGNIGWGQWYPNIDALAKHFTVYALDLPGGGRSMTIDFSRMDLERDLVGVVEEFIRQQGFSSLDLVGSSMGGWIALKLALKKNPTIRKLIIVNSAGLSDYLSVPDRIISIAPLAHFLSRTVFKPVRSNTRVEQFLRSVLHNRATPLLQEFIDYFYETMERSHNVLFISRLMREARKRTILLIEHLSSIPHETLIIWGEQDALMPIAKYAPAFSKIPKAKIHVIKEAGHIPSLEKPEEFNRAVIDFLKMPFPIQ